MKTESINPFDQAQQPEQFARYACIAAAILEGKTDKELWEEFKVGPKSVAEVRAALANSEGKKEPGSTSPPAPLPIAPQRGEGGDETAPDEGTRPTTTEA